MRDACANVRASPGSSRLRLDPVRSGSCESSRSIPRLIVRRDYRREHMTRKEIADNVMRAYPRHEFLNADPEDYHPHFSWSKCELCDEPAGDRYNVAAIVIGEPGTEDERVDFEVCVDCMYYAAYGEFPPEYDE